MEPVILQSHFERASRVFPGVVVGVNGTSPGPASGITYDVEVNLPGAPKALFPQVIPSGARWPDTVDTIAAASGTPISALMYGDAVVFTIPEQPATVEQECP